MRLDLTNEQQVVRARFLAEHNEHEVEWYEGDYPFLVVGDGMEALSHWVLSGAFQFPDYLHMCLYYQPCQFCKGAPCKGHGAMDYVSSECLVKSENDFFAFWKRMPHIIKAEMWVDGLLVATRDWTGEAT